MNRLSVTDKTRIVACLVEGNSIASTCRMTGFSKGAVLRLLAAVGNACDAHHDRRVRGLKCARVQADEIWSFVASKEKNVAPEHKGELGYGDVYTWVGLCADTKLAIAYLVGKRDAGYAAAFVDDMASRLDNRVQLTTDGLRIYMDAVYNAFDGGAIDYAMLVKHYGLGAPSDQRRYSPSSFLGSEAHRVSGDPTKEHISTSFVERQNLTMRMHMRRFTRLTNAFSKKIKPHAAAVALHFAHYNFCRIHKTLRVTPAMEAGIADRVWEVEDLVWLAETNV